MPSPKSWTAARRINEARGDVAGAARCFDYYAGAADKNEGRSFPLGEDYASFSINEPVGVTAHIVPWNYPLSTAARSIAPALAAGCTAVVKPAEQTPMTALMLAELLSKAGLPDGVCNVVTGTGTGVGAPLVGNPVVRHVTFTGSTATGTNVMSAAARTIASVTLELGGKSPNVVLADCDLDLALDNVAGAIYENAGQICSAGSRLVIDRSIHAEFIGTAGRARRWSTHRARSSRAREFWRDQFGRAPGQDIVLSRRREKPRRWRSRQAATRQSIRRPATGWFFEPTIVDDLAWDDPLVQEEIFGPVLAVQVVDDLDEAIAAANCTDYALVAGIFTRDLSKAHRFARQVDAGQVYVNEFFAGGIETPFGGNRKSGHRARKGTDRGQQLLQDEVGDDPYLTETPPSARDWSDVRTPIDIASGLSFC